MIDHGLGKNLFKNTHCTTKRIPKELHKALQNNENDCYKKVTLCLMNGCQSLMSKDTMAENMKCK